MPLKPSRKLPKKFSRRVSAETKRFLDRRLERRRAMRKEKWRGVTRRAQRLAADFRVSLIRSAIVLLAVLALFGAGMLLFSPILEVREIRVTRRDPRLDIEAVQGILSPMFRRHILFLSQAEVRTLLDQHLTDARKVTVRKRYPSVLQIAIELDPLIARVQIEEPEGSGEAVTATGSTADFLTDEGAYALAPATGRTETLPLIRLVDWGVRPLPGANLLTPAFLEALKGAEEALVRQFGYGVEERVVFLRAQEFHIDVGPFNVWFDTRSSIGDQLQRFRTFLRSIDPREVREYVDVRIANRVIYK